NMGTVLMRSGIPYDSPEGVAICGALTAIMHGEAYATSARMAKDLGPFPGFQKNRLPMLRVIRNHRRAACNAPARDYEGLTITPLRIDHKHFPQALLEPARATRDRDLGLGAQFRHPNAQGIEPAP